MIMTQRQVVLISIGINATGSILVATLLFLDRQWNLALTVGALGMFYVALFVAYRRGWRYAPHTLIAVISLATGAVSPVIDPRAGLIPITLLFPAALAVAVMSPAWVVISSIVTLTIYMARVFAVGQVITPFDIIVYVMLTGILFVARSVLDTTARQADEARQRAEMAQTRAEEQAHALEIANATQQAQLDEQRRLLDLVATLEVPAITLADGVLLAPIVGHLDSRRSAMLTARLLEAAHHQRAQHVIIDISGVPAVDTAVAQTLINTAQALKLLGCRVTLTGISPEVAQTLTLQGIRLSDIDTVRSLQEAMQ